MKSAIVMPSLATNLEVTANVVGFNDKVEILTLGVALIV